MLQKGNPAITKIPFQFSDVWLVIVHLFLHQDLGAWGQNFLKAISWKSKNLSTTKQAALLILGGQKVNIEPVSGIAEEMNGERVFFLFLVSKQSAHQILVVLSSDKHSLVKLIPPSPLLTSNVIASGLGMEWKLSIQRERRSFIRYLYVHSAFSERPQGQENL